ncbi:cation:proton antiporter domain-containing protein [Thiohalomonas denitrificans]|uniref:cation:proton antiporter domain-containing protein n=1 Tax=Thiohalomonas denitrificans TaxID=415747 RepID=UPI0026E95EF6|nr:cation:proton antiporter [Thiohalomonas denitrificans]
MHDPIVYNVFLIFAGAALLATAALFTRQSMLVSYILVGVLFGPWGFGLTEEPEAISAAAHMGVIFLLFLLGLNLHPQKLLGQLGRAVPVTLLSSLLFAAIGGGVALAFGFGARESLLIGAACIFSSTIIGLKLLPTTQLHHQRTGEVIISVLLLQDLIAIVILLLLQAVGTGDAVWWDIGVLMMGLPALVVAAWLGARYVVVPLFCRFDTIQEYVFLLTIGWCLGMAQLAALLGLSQEIGAFIGGIALAASPISTFIAESLKPLRDFFLVMFFFALGATFDLGMIGEVLPAAVVLAALLLLAKPVAFGLLLKWAGEEQALAWEVGVRLGQVSEFSLFIVILALESEVISRGASYTVQLATLLTFIVSSYVIMLNYPTPIAVSDRLRRD